MDATSRDGMLRPRGEGLENEVLPLVEALDVVVPAGAAQLQLDDTELEEGAKAVAEKKEMNLVPAAAEPAALFERDERLASTAPGSAPSTILTQPVAVGDEEEDFTCVEAFDLEERDEMPVVKGGHLASARSGSVQEVVPPEVENGEQTLEDFSLDDDQSASRSRKNEQGGGDKNQEQPSPTETSGGSDPLLTESKKTSPAMQPEVMKHEVNLTRGTLLRKERKALVRKTICRHYLVGKCSKGEWCRFRHPIDPKDEKSASISQRQFQSFLPTKRNANPRTAGFAAKSAFAGTSANAAGATYDRKEQSGDLSTSSTKPQPALNKPNDRDARGYRSAGPGRNYNQNLLHQQHPGQRHQDGTVSSAGGRNFSGTSTTSRLVTSSSGASRGPSGNYPVARIPTQHSDFCTWIWTFATSVPRAD
ncbi:unnamed protein product [Amoebophrya sp. A120]|nr:unnamed protein product [Amoebophrya sp. A120]|eukprot:GSA120T00005621001.1